MELKGLSGGLYTPHTQQDIETIHEASLTVLERTGIEVMYLPMLEDYHIDLGFDLKWT